MTRITRTAGGLALGSVLAVFAPFNVDLTSGPRVVPLEDACGQATSCKPQENYICSTFNGNERGYTCNTGCEPPPET